MTAKRSDLDLLQGLVVKALMTRIEEGTATASDLNVARQLLKDNNVSILPMESAKDLQALADTLPFADLASLQAETETFN